MEGLGTVMSRGIDEANILTNSSLSKIKDVEKNGSHCG
jgi:hypothetical protein